MRRCTRLLGTAAIVAAMGCAAAKSEGPRASPGGGEEVGAQITSTGAEESTDAVRDDGYAPTSAPAEAEYAPAPPAPTAPTVADRISGGGGKGKREAKVDGPRMDTGAAPPAKVAERAEGGALDLRARGGGPSGYVAPVAVAAPAMKAGRYDDNKQYNRFLTFMGENARLAPHPLDVNERLVIQVVDKDGKSMPNCSVEVKSLDGKVLSKTTTFADGRTMFFPSADAKPSDKDFTLTATCGKEKRNGQWSRAGKREVQLRFPQARVVTKPVPVDVAIVLDTTGSMGGQIDRLKQTLQAIHFQLTQLPVKPDLRLGLVAYRDRDDDYVTRVTPFTADVAQMQRAIDKLDADGGGDTPEDLQQAFNEAMRKLDWRFDAVRVGFAISDAIPHTDYRDQTYTYRDAMRDGLRRGVKWAMVGAGGLPLDGEVIFRQIAQFTMSEYVFVTQGEGGDSAGGVGEASHHVGSNYQVENLDQAMIRIVKRELSYLTDTPKDFDDTIVATATTPSVPRDKVLAPAVAEVLRQLADYSAIRLKPATPVAVLPAESTDAAYNAVAEYVSEQMVFAATRNPSFKVLERDLSKIGQELKLATTDFFDAEQSAQVGKLLGAELLIVAKLQVHASGATLFAKLVRVETGEMLSVAKVDMNKAVLQSS